MTAALNVNLPDTTHEQAAEIAAAISNAGAMSFTNVNGDQVTVNVGSVTVAGLCWPCPRGLR